MEDRKVEINKDASVMHDGTEYIINSFDHAGNSLGSSREEIRHNSKEGTELNRSH